MLKHLMIIEDGEPQENSLHLSDRARAEALIEWAKDFCYGDQKEELAEVMQEVDEEAAQADYPPGVSAPSSPKPEDYVDAVRDFLSNNCDVDTYLDDLAAPEGASAEVVRTE